MRWRSIEFKSLKKPENNCLLFNFLAHFFLLHFLEKHEHFHRSNSTHTKLFHLITKLFRIFTITFAKQGHNHFNAQISNSGFRLFVPQFAKNKKIPHSGEWMALLLEQRILGVSQADGLPEAGWWWEVHRGG